MPPYKTIVLALLQQRPQLHDQLRRNRMLLPTLERSARALKTSHAAWKERLAQEQPASDASQVASQALEFALQELETSWATEDGNTDEPLSLAGAMGYLRRHTPPA